jgi:hypothetical protein
MGTFQAAPDAVAVAAAGNAVGLYNERAVQALQSIPAAIWDTGTPAATGADLTAAVRKAMNNVGLYDEMGDNLAAKVVLKAVVTVPNVVGATVAAARAALAAAGCRVGTVEEVEGVPPAGLVLTQSVAPGASEVYVVVNLTYSDGEGT